MDQVRFAAIGFRTTVEHNDPYSIRYPVYELMEYELLEAVNEDAPDSVGNAFQAAGNWCWLDSERGVIQTLWTGFAITFPVAFAVLLLSTGNVIVTFFAILSIFLIVGNVLGFFNYAMGWPLGFLEAVVAVVVVGFSIDYVLHLAHMLEEAATLAKLMLRRERVQYALENMGTTIVAGAITTAGSASFMFLCQVYGFNKMAIMICTTIMFSVLYTFLFFVPAMMLFGPEYEQGNVTFINTVCNAIFSTSKKSNGNKGNPSVGTGSGSSGR